MGFIAEMPLFIKCAPTPNTVLSYPLDLAHMISNTTHAEGSVRANVCATLTDNIRRIAFVTNSGLRSNEAYCRTILDQITIE